MLVVYATGVAVATVATLETLALYASVTNAVDGMFQTNVHPAKAGPRFVMVTCTPYASPASHSMVYFTRQLIDVCGIVVVVTPCVVVVAGVVVVVAAGVVVAGVVVVVGRTVVVVTDGMVVLTDGVVVVGAIVVVFPGMMVVVAATTPTLIARTSSGAGAATALTARRRAGDFTPMKSKWFFMYLDIASAAIGSLSELRDCFTSETYNATRFICVAFVDRSTMLI